MLWVQHPDVLKPCFFVLLVDVAVQEEDVGLVLVELELGVSVPVQVHPRIDHGPASCPDVAVRGLIVGQGPCRRELLLEDTAIEHNRVQAHPRVSDGPLVKLARVRHRYLHADLVLVHPVWVSFLGEV